MKSLSFPATIYMLFFLFILPLPCHAHRITLFAWAENTVIYGESSFSGKRKPVNVDVSLLNAVNQTVLLTTQTDGNGKFKFNLPERVLNEHPDLVLIINTGEGHRAEWPIPASDYLQSSVLVPEKKKQKPETVEIKDILGGLGCIFTLAGIIGWLQVRKKKELETKS
jgi:nickel transport protein